MKYLLDTSIIIRYLRHDAYINSLINDLTISHELFISIFSVAELYHGAYKSINADKNVELIEKLIKTPEITTINIDKKVTEIYGVTFAELEKIGQKIDPSDLIIASSGKSVGATIITSDEKHFLRLENFGFKIRIE